MSLYGFLHGGSLFRSKPSDDDDDDDEDEEELDESSGADDHISSRPWGLDNNGYESEE